MSILVLIETSEGISKKSSLEAVSYAAQINDDVIGIVFGEIDSNEIAENAGKAGATKVLHISDEKYNTNNIQAFASAISHTMDQTDSNTFVLAKSSLGDSVSARVAIKTNASLASNVVSLPDQSNGYKVKTSIYTGKAFAKIELTESNKVISIKKNTLAISENGSPASIETLDLPTNDQDFQVKILSQDKKIGEVLLPEADIVVSAGRGLKGPENWTMIEELASELGAATGCSKPVSDMDWRPHHEHVGQTGIKVSPSLYIAIGISGAIQHLAGVNSSKYILVINNDLEAPFFKSADFGVVGDAFEVVPKLIEQIKKSK